MPPPHAAPVTETTPSREQEPAPHAMPHEHAHAPHADVQAASPATEAMHAESALERPTEAPSRPAAPVVPQLPPISLDLAPDSGLVLVETTHRIESLPEDDASAQGPRRARRPRAQVSDEPLQIIETRKDAPPAT